MKKNITIAIMILIKVNGTLYRTSMGRCLYCSNRAEFNSLVYNVYDHFFTCSNKCYENLRQLHVVSLDPYRTKGVSIFSGEGRGKVVAEEIARRYSNNVSILIPNDVISISRSFRQGFNSVMTGKFPYNISVFQMSNLLK